MTERETNAAKLLGRKGGRSKSEAKVTASRDNGRKGGAPITRCQCGHRKVAHIAGVCGVCECSNYQPDCEFGGWTCGQPKMT